MVGPQTAAVADQCRGHTQHGCGGARQASQEIRPYLHDQRLRDAAPNPLTKPRQSSAKTSSIIRGQNRRRGGGRTRNCGRVGRRDVEPCQRHRPLRLEHVVAVHTARGQPEIVSHSARSRLLRRCQRSGAGACCGRRQGTDRRELSFGRERGLLCRDRANGGQTARAVDQYDSRPAGRVAHRRPRYGTHLGDHRQGADDYRRNWRRSSRRTSFAAATRPCASWAIGPRRSRPCSRTASIGWSPRTSSAYGRPRASLLPASPHHRRAAKWKSG